MDELDLDRRIRPSASRSAGRRAGRRRPGVTRAGIMAHLRSLFERAGDRGRCACAAAAGPGTATAPRRRSTRRRRQRRQRDERDHRMRPRQPEHERHRRRRRAATEAMFENGSGEVLAAARVVSLAAWLVAASVPPSSAAAVAQRRLVAAEHRRRRAPRRPESGSKRVDRVPDAVEAGDLVDEELDEQHQAAGAEHDRVGERRAGRPAASIQPSQPGEPGDEQTTA